jgi:transcriptional regulator with PAS, ATPase and Fis domain
VLLGHARAGTYGHRVSQATWDDAARGELRCQPRRANRQREKLHNLVVNINPIKKQRKAKGAVCTFLTMDEFEIIAKRLKSFSSLDKQFQTVYESSSDGIWICDHDGKVISINGASERLGGIKRQDIIGKNVSDIIKKRAVQQLRDR